MQPRALPGGGRLGGARGREVSCAGPRPTRGPQPLGAPWRPRGLSAAPRRRVLPDFSPLTRRHPQFLLTISPVFPLTTPLFALDSWASPLPPAVTILSSWSPGGYCLLCAFPCCVTGAAWLWGGQSTCQRPREKDRERVGRRLGTDSQGAGGRDGGRAQGHGRARPSPSPGGQGSQGWETGKED